MAFPAVGAVNHSRSAYSSSHSRVATIVILVFAFCLRLVAAWLWHDSTIGSDRLFRLGDSDSYWVLAGHIARGEPYEYGSANARIFRAPLYPIALAPFTLITDPSRAVWWARVFGCACGTLAVALVMELARRVRNGETKSRIQNSAGDDQASPASDRAALWSGVVAAIYPGAIGMSIVILSESIFCPLMLATLLLWHFAMTGSSSIAAPIAGHDPRLQSAGSLNRWVLVSSLIAGAFSGLAVLARPSWLLFMPLAGLVVLLFRRDRLRQLSILVVMAIGCVAVMLPWWVRNAIITARFVPTTLQVGAGLYDGLHAGASGASDENMAFVDRFVQEQERADAEYASRFRQNAEAAQTETSARTGLRMRSTFEYRLNARMQAAAVDWLKKNVSGAIRLSLVKFARTWSLWPNAGEIGSTWVRALLTLACLGVLGCALAASWQLRRNAPWLIALCWLPAVYFTLLHMVFVGSIRYREPAMLVLTALAGCAISQLPFIQRQTRKSLD